MLKFNGCSWYYFLCVIITSSVRSESDEEEPIPELNDYEEAYRLFEYAKTTLNPLASFPFISTTNKQIAEYLLLSGGASKWRRTLLSVNRGTVEQPACVVRRIFKDGSIKHDLFREKSIRIKKEFGSYEEHTIAFQYNWHANKKKIEMLKCPCVFESGEKRLSKELSVKPKYVDEDELKLIEKMGRKVSLRIVPTTNIVTRNRRPVPRKKGRDGFPNVDAYPYQSSEEDSIRSQSIRLLDKVSARRILGRDICINGHVLLGRGINGDNSFFVFARDRGFLRVVAHLVFR